MADHDPPYVLPIVIPSDARDLQFAEVEKSCGILITLNPPTGSDLLFAARIYILLIRWEIDQHRIKLEAFSRACEGKIGPSQQSDSGADQGLSYEHCQHESPGS